MPLIGFVHGGSAATYVPFLNAFRQGLRQTGFVEGSNVAIRFRWAENERGKFPDFVAEMVRLSVNIIVIGGGDDGLHAAKAATSTIPVVGAYGRDPVQSALVKNLNRPDGNLTGISVFAVQLVAKRLELAREFVAASEVVAFLHDPANPNSRPNAWSSARQPAISAQRFLLAPVSTEA